MASASTSQEDGSPTPGGGTVGDERVEAPVLPGAPFPPRPKAIATFLSSSDFLPGCQALLHSIKKKLPETKSKTEYAPEIIVLVSSKIASDTSVISRLHPIFCTRIIPVEHIPISTNADETSDKKPSHVKTWDENCGWTKLRVFELEGYGTILYVDADCLVVKDVSHLLNIGGESDSDEGKRKGLLAASPDIFPPDKFNAGVMVLRPSKAVFDDMMARLPDSDSTKSNESKDTCKSYDGGDTGFLNSYYPNWFRDMPSYSRLSFGYNAQRFMHHCTIDKQPNYWNEGIQDLHIIHFSSSPKPWETKSHIEASNKRNSSESFLDEKDTDAMQSSKRGKLENMWHAAYEQSQKYYAKESQKQKQSAAKSNAKSAQPRGASANPPPAAPPLQSSKTMNLVDIHKMVQRRYRELRKTGMGTKEAMDQASAEHGIDTVNEGMDPSQAVGRMFGLM